MKNKKIVWIVVGMVSVVLIALAITYAYWQITKTQQGVNEISSACLDISLVDAESGNTGVTLQDQYPLSDTEGATLKPYKFTVTNNCDTAVDYQIALESTGSSTDALKASSLKVMLDSTTSLLNAKETVTPTIDGAYASHKLGMGTLAKNGDAGSSVTHELRLWIDEAAPVSENNKTYNGKITVTIGQGISASTFEKGSLAYTLIKAYGGEAAITELDSSAFATATDENESGMYKAMDDYGDSYYYRGNVTNNYVKFGVYMAGSTVGGNNYDVETPIYWRIVRINGDGTIRLAYDGVEKANNGTSYGYIGYNPYNVSGDSPDSVDYMNSNIKSVVDDWYVEHLKDTYSTYIADSIFCHDREEAYTITEDVDSDNLIEDITYYKGYERLINARPKLTCSNPEDRLTVDDNVLGNAQLSNPIGLITSDELLMAGYSYNEYTIDNHLDIGEYYYTLTPSSFEEDSFYGRVAKVFGTPSYDSRAIDRLEVGGEVGWGVRPVINLKSDVEFTIDEDGTYVITTN